MKKREKHKTAKSGFNRKLLYSVILVTVILLSSLIVYYLFSQPYTENWAAAIVDQVTIEGLFNQEFNVTIASLLNASEFDVKYYPGNSVTVDFYKAFPSKGGKIIIVRAHSAVRNNSDYVDLFTSEPFVEGKYSAYGNQISRARFLTSNNEYFAIGPTFVDSSVRGNFDGDCVIILMGCSSLEKESMAKALVDKGARVVIGWTTAVELSDTDASTIQLLHYLLVDKYNIEIAVGKMNPPNHPYHPLGATMDYYPKSAGNFIVPTRENETSLVLVGRCFQILLSVILPKWKQDKAYLFVN